MRDLDIKRLLREKIFAKIKEGDPSSFLIEEMEVCRGDARVDVAIVNGRISGYEIKSSLDDLRRLPNQISMYSRVLDSISVVATKAHLQEAERLVPEWWGLIALIEADACFNVVRQPEENPSIDPISVASLLWRDEALSVLSSFGLERGVKSKPREELWVRLAERLPLDELQREVRLKLKDRINWRVDPLPGSDDVLSPLFSM